MDHFIDAFNEVVLVEGGYSDDPADSGGKTMYGITERVARKACFDGEMQDLTLQEAQRIYRALYWDAVCGDDLAAVNPTLAHEVFDSAVNVGTHRASEWLQRALNVLNQAGALYADITVDGDIGPATLGALEKYAQSRSIGVLLKALNSLQGAFYIELAERRHKDERFVYGWLRTRVGM